jgi:hypothetical protein
MSVEAITWALSFEAESATEKAILLVLANYADRDGATWWSQKAIAQQACCSDRTVRNTLVKLEERGIIKRIERLREDGSRSSDRVVLVAFMGVENSSGGAESLSGGAEPVSGGVRKELPGGAERASALTTFETKDETKEGNIKRKRARLPADWSLPSEFLTYALQAGLTEEEAHAESIRMRDWSRDPDTAASKAAKSHWDRCWKNWVDDTVSRKRSRPASHADRHQSAVTSRRSAFMAAANEAAKRGHDSSWNAGGTGAGPGADGGNGPVIDASEAGRDSAFGGALGQPLPRISARRGGG